MSKVVFRYKNKKFNPAVLCSFLMIVCVMLLTIGYSAFEVTMEIIDISALVQVQNDIQVTNVSVLEATNGAVSNYEDHTADSITSSVNLPEQNSTITYRIQTKNFGNTKQGIYAIDEIYKYISTGLDSDLEIKSKTVNLKKALCTNSNSSECTLGATTTFDITIGYKNNGCDGVNLTHLIELDFDFRRVFDITYVGFSNTSGLSTQMIYGDVKTITFNNTTGIPTRVIVDGASGTYSSPTLTLEDITIKNLEDTIVITKAYSVSYVGFSGNTSGLISTITSSGETIQFNNTTGIPDKVIVTGATPNYENSPNLVLTNVTNDVTITKAYSVSYVDFSGNTSGLTSVIPSTGGTIVFNNTTGIPQSVTVTGATPDYDNPPNLVLTSVTGSVTITAVNNNVVVINNEDGTKQTISENVVNNGDGSTTTTTVKTNYDANNNRTSSSTTTTTQSSNGSTSVTKNYDAQNNLVDGSTAITDTSGNVNTQEVEYDSNGLPYVVGYKIDTTNNANGAGESIVNGLDTGLIAFDGRPFTVHLKCKVNPADQPTTAVFVSALEAVPDTSNKYNGFTIDLYNKQSVISFGGSNSDIKNTYFGSRISGTVDQQTGIQDLKYLKSGTQTIVIDATYIPKALEPEWAFTIKVETLYTTKTSSTKQTEAKSTMYSNSGYLPQSLETATVTIGSYGVEHSHDMVGLEVLEFTVKKD